MAEQNAASPQRRQGEQPELPEANMAPAAAQSLEVCTTCGRVRDRKYLARCYWCDDVYYCRDGTCCYAHYSQGHQIDTIRLR